MIRLKATEVKKSDIELQEWYILHIVEVAATAALGIEIFHALLYCEKIFLL